MPARVTRQRAALRPEPPARLYAVLDAARHHTIHPALLDLAHVDDVATLYDGEAAIALADVAPYLVTLDPDGAAFDWLWGNSALRGAAIYLTSAAEPAALRAHLRRLTRVRTEDGRVLLFRFYDPLIMRTFLPSCDAQQLSMVFGPIQRIVLADQDPPVGLRLRDQVLETEEVAQA
jgi:hypothetical protein